jgi:acyl-CoA thioester hydrolase
VTGGGPAPTEADFPFWTEEKLRVADTDMGGHVNNGAIGAFCEAGRAELMMEAGGDPRTRPFAMAVARVAIDYRREIHYPGRVRIGSRVSRLGTSSVAVAQGLFKDGVLFATAEGVMVILDPATRRPAAMPEAVRSRFAAFAGPGGVG